MSGRGGWNNLGQWGIFGTRSMVLDAADKYVCAHTLFVPPGHREQHMCRTVPHAQGQCSDPRPTRARGVGSDSAFHLMARRRMLFSLAVESVRPPAPSRLPGSPEMDEPSSSSCGPLRFEVNQELRLGVAMLTMEEDEVPYCALGPPNPSFRTD